MGHLITVSVGTDHHQFNRLMDWVDQWIETASQYGFVDLEIIVQRGSSKTPRNCESSKIIAHDQLCELFARSDAVICHGGPSTVMDVRLAGRLPIVVPRDPEFGEHVDDHQIRFSKYLGKNDVARIVTKKLDLGRYLSESLLNPESYTVAKIGGATPGVVEFGNVVDSLINTRTPIVPDIFDGSLHDESIPLNKQFIL